MKFIGESLLVQTTGKRHQSYIFKFKIIKMLKGNYDKDTIIFEQYHDFGGGALFLALRYKSIEYEDKEKEFGENTGLRGPIRVCENDIFEIDRTKPGNLKFKKLERKDVI